MINKIRNTIYSSLITLCVISFGVHSVFAQSSGTVVKGLIIESGTGNPLNQVSISVSSTGELAGSDDNGNFSINVPNNQSELIFNLPGYKMRKIFTN
ncbi:MAG: hypothetical protein CO099_09400, partial [Bdellovibrio sp. CG_4_9_14_3_um_filter_39_7]